jgi:hypothetical protein
MLLDQTSEWEGTLFGKADRIDRGRDLKREGAGPKGMRPPAADPRHLLGIQTTSG